MGLTLKDKVLNEETFPTSDNLGPRSHERVATGVAITMSACPATDTTAPTHTHRLTAVLDKETGLVLDNNTAAYYMVTREEKVRDRKRMAHERNSVDGEHKKARKYGTHRLVHNLNHAGLQLRDDGRVAGGNTVLARASRDDHLAADEGASEAGARRYG